MVEKKERKKMNKVLSTVLTSAAIVALCGCSSSSSTAETSSAASSASATEEATAETVVDDGTKSEGVMTYEEYVAADLDSEVTVETYVQAKQGWWEDNGVGKATLYTQDQDGAYFIYDLEMSNEEYEQLTEGTKIKVTGYKSEWSGEVEIIDASFEIEEGNFVAETLDVTDLLANEEELSAHQNEKVSFTGLTVAASTDANGEDAAYLYNWDGSGTQGDDLYFNVELDGNTYTFTVESYLCDKDSDVYKAVEAFNIGDTVDLEGFLYWYNGANPHITSAVVK